MKVLKGFVSVFCALLLFLVYYFWQPTLSPAFNEGIAFIFICLGVLFANIYMWATDNDDGGDVSLIFCTIAVLIAALGCLIDAVLIFMGSSIFNSTTMQQQLGEVEVVEFNEMIKQIDTSQIPIVDEAFARKQAEKKLGEEIALGSRVELGDGAVQEVNGEILWVFPLEHTGFFKWYSNNSIPAYITVSASNQNKVNFVTQVDGKDLDIKYSPSAYFGYDLKRHIRKNGFRYVGLTEYTFEINDEGHPYWVVTTYKNRTMHSNPDAEGVVVVDAQTGETQYYDVAETPEWVDIVQPREFVEDQIDNWGKLIHGWWNPGHTDMIEKTDLLLTVYVDGDCYYFTGMTSVGSDDSCVGFIMVNTRTKKSEICYMTGATENAAMSSAQGLVSDFGYTSTEPLPINVNGVPTYTMALKDEEGLNKLYAMVNIENYSIAAKGSSLQEAMRAYLQSVTRNSGVHVVASDEAYGYSYEGKVVRISSTVEDGSTYYYLVLEGEEDKIFSASYTVSNELAVTRDGDTVKIHYIDDKNGTVDIIEFDNIAFATPVSEDQKSRDEMDKGTSAFDSEENSVIDVDPEKVEKTWDSMSDEEKAKLMEHYATSQDATLQDG